jgi:hypothetical protein
MQIQFLGESKFNGLVEHGLRNGFGAETWENGDVYEGNYAEDLRHGHGCLNKADGTRYRGNFE